LISQNPSKQEVIPGHPANGGAMAELFLGDIPRGVLEQASPQKSAPRIRAEKGSYAACSYSDLKKIGTVKIAKLLTHFYFHHLLPWISIFHP
jgi:hypothetical protein